MEKDVYAVYFHQQLLTAPEGKLSFYAKSLVLHRTDSGLKTEAKEKENKDMNNKVWKVSAARLMGVLSGCPRGRCTSG